jgi:release factor glutamine methyltransferase
LNEIRTIAQWLEQARDTLKQALTLSAREAALEAHVLVGHALGKPRAYLLAHRDDDMEPAAATRFRGLLGRRMNGEPIAYILGEREFYGLAFAVSPAVLIPRPETELLVELALAYTKNLTAPSILDLGTGSGAIALAIAKHKPSAQVAAVEQSPDALAVARQNAERLGLTSPRFLLGDWFSPVPAGERFDLIVANPPYIAATDPHLDRGDLRFEPRPALASGPEGLDAIQHIAAGAEAHLAPEGRLLIEHGFDQGERCRALLAEAGFIATTTHQDLAGLDRVTEAIRPAQMR